MRTDGNYKHGGHGTRLYNIWKTMRERCDNPHHNRYQSYGGKGIKYCDKWNDFAAFRDWALNNGYSDELTIDRVDNNGNYCEENCRWITNKQQANNKSTNVFIEYHGDVHTIAEWAEIKNIKIGTLWARLRVQGWDIEKALNTPVHIQ